MLKFYFLRSSGTSVRVSGGTKRETFTTVPVLHLSKGSVCFPLSVVEFPPTGSSSTRVSSRDIRVTSGHSTAGMAPRNDRKNPLMHLVAGGVAGVVESSCCHPLDTVKTRMQLRIKGGSTKGPLRTASSIITKEGFLALYKGLSAVMMGIVPKMAVRFTSFETYKEWLGASPTGNKGG